MEANQSFIDSLTNRFSIKGCNKNEALCLALRVMGYSHEEIAKQFRLSKSRVIEIKRKALKIIQKSEDLEDKKLKKKSQFSRTNPISEDWIRKTWLTETLNELKENFGGSDAEITALQERINELEKENIKLEKRVRDLTVAMVENSMRH